VTGAPYIRGFAASPTLNIPLSTMGEINPIVPPIIIPSRAGIRISIADMAVFSTDGAAANKKLNVLQGFLAAFLGIPNAAGTDLASIGAAVVLCAFAGLQVLGANAAVSQSGNICIMPREIWIPPGIVGTSAITAVSFQGFADIDNTDGVSARNAGCEIDVLYRFEVQ
jgi:hypothetical protein